SDGNSYQVDSVFIHQADGITASGLDNLKLVGLNGITASGLDTRDITYADGLTAFGINGITISGANGITASGLDGQTFSISPNGLTISGASGITASGLDNILFTGADGITASGLDDAPPLPPGLQSVDPELAILLDHLTDDSNVNAAVVYHQAVTDADIATLRQLGVLLGQRYHVLPVVSVTATKRQI